MEKDTEGMTATIREREAVEHEAVSLPIAGQNAPSVRFHLESVG
jgi:hypothetical protein